MGTYALDTTHVDAFGLDFITYHEKSVRERNNLIQASENVVEYNTIVPQELRHIFQDQSEQHPGDFPPFYNLPLTAQDASVHRNPDTGKLNLFWRKGGQGSYAVGQLNESTGLIDRIKYASIFYTLEPRKWVYFPKLKAYGFNSVGSVEFADGETFELIKKAYIGFLGFQIAYRPDNNSVYAFADYGGGTYGIGQVDFGGTDFSLIGDDEIYNIGDNLFTLPSVPDISNFRFLEYNEYLDKITFFDSSTSTMYIVDPYTLGQTTATVPNFQYFGSIVGYKERPNTDEAYVLYYENGNVTLAHVKLTASTPAEFIISTKIISKTTDTATLLNNLDKINLVYTDKAVVVAGSYEADGETNFLRDGYWTKVFTSDIQYDLTNEKRFYIKEDVINPASGSTATWYSTLAYNDTWNEDGQLTETRRNVFTDVYAETLSSGVDRIYFPMYAQGGFGEDSIGQQSYLSYMDITPFTPYTVLTEEEKEDCCIDELVSEAKNKLAQYSCEVTKRSIVGRHYGNMWAKSQMIEAILWVSEMNCLTCDDIETLRCIISKI